MSEIVHVLQTPVLAADTVWRAEVWGAARQDGLWEGWLTFVPAAAGDALSTSRETTQPNREALVYWATGLEPVYLEGAFLRAARADRNGRPLLVAERFDGVQTRRLAGGVEPEEDPHGRGEPEG